MELIPKYLTDHFDVTELDTELRKKVGPMKFAIRHYSIAGVGHLSVMRGTAMLGLMKMDTVILTPVFRDVPLFSYDRILAMGNDTLILEYYDTLVDPALREAGGFREKAASLADLPDHDLGQKWYDYLKLPGCVSKRAKKVGGRFDRFYQESFEAYLKRLTAAPLTDPAVKNEKTAAYVDGLFDNGGPSTDQFVKAMGREDAKRLFETVIFGHRM